MEQRCMRVKIYCLEDSAAGAAAGVWVDRGTGLCRVDRGSLLVVAEERDSMSVGPSPALLLSRIRMDDVYERQGESIIMWREAAEEPGSSADYALSFQDASGCHAVWKAIADAQGRYASGWFERRGYLADYDDRKANTSSMSSSHNRSALVCSLPEVTFATLKDIKESLCYCLAYGAGSISLRDAYARLIADKDMLYLRQLLNLWTTSSERWGDEPRLLFGSIIRCVLQLNSAAVYAFITRDADVFATISSALEHDYDATLGPHARPRPALGSFATDHTKRWVNVVSLRDDTVDKVHLLHRLTLLRDVLLGEEVGLVFSELASAIALLSIELSTRLVDESTSLIQVCERASTGELNPLLFLKELLGLVGRQVPQDQRQTQLRLLFSAIDVSFYSAMTAVLRLPRVDPIVLRTAAELLHDAIALNPAAAIAHIVRGAHPALSDTLHADCPSLLLAMARHMCSSNDSAVVESLGEATRSLLDPLGAADQGDRDRFTNVFYDAYVRLFVPSPDMNASTVRGLCAVLGLCVTYHSYRMKYFVMRNAVISRVLACLTKPERAVHVEVVRFIKAVVLLKDDFYHRHIVKGDLLRPLFLALTSRDNLVTSMVLDLIEFIRVEKVTLLTDYIVERHSSAFDIVQHADSFDRLRLRYEQMRDDSTEERFNKEEQSIHVQQRNDDMNDDAYFDADEEDKSDVCAPMGSAMRVLLDTYGDEEVQESPAKRRRDSSLAVGQTQIATVGQSQLAQQDEGSPPLPPLRSKFEVDDDSSDAFLFAPGRPTDKRKPTISFSINTKKAF